MTGWYLYLAVGLGVYIRVALKAALQLSVVEYKFARIIPLSYVSQVCELVIIGASATAILHHKAAVIVGMIAVMGTAAWAGTHTSMRIHRRLNERSG